MNIYDRLKTPPSSLTFTEIVDHYPQITDEDKENGYVVRYFTRQVNHSGGDITEIDKPTFSRLKSNPMYTIVSLEWRIVGPLDDIIQIGHNTVIGVRSANRITLEAADAELKGMKYRLTNLSQFWIGK